MRRALLLSLVAITLALLPSAAGGSNAAATGDFVQVVAMLDSPPLARAAHSKLQTATWVRGDRIALGAPASIAYLGRLEVEQRTLERRIEAAIPSAQIRWRYRITVNGLAVVLPRRDLAKLEALVGSERVYPNVRYRPRLDTSPGLIGAPELWGAGLATAGQGIKIGIIDDGVDQKHPFFAPAGYTYPAGYPKGQRGFTTPKVIVARAFPPPRLSTAIARSPDDRKPFDPGDSFHGTHVAGIAAGNQTKAQIGGRTRTLSGIAPKAYIGNYKALSVPTPDVGLDGNAPELAAAIEAAVADGMNVINLSIGEPEIEPSRDLVVQALNGAADAGVVPVVAAGNDFGQFGAGSINSPGSAEKAITVAAAGKDRTIASFSSGGPTPVSLALKPDLTAPGVSILSSVPAAQGLWGPIAGTSMASPHVAGAAAVLRQRHAGWTVEQIKSALVQTGGPVYDDESRVSETPATREGGGFVDLSKADRPLLFARPSGVSFGLLRAGQTEVRSVSLADAGGGSAAWTVTVAAQRSDPAVTVTAPPSVTAPGELQLTASAGSGARGLDLTGFVVLTRDAEVRRVPYWLSVSSAALSAAQNVPLRRPGVYRGDTRGKQSLVTTYRYPRGGNRFPGPEQVFRVTLTRPVANFGVVMLSGARGIEPRIVYAGDESHLVGYPGLPLYLNPYTTRYGEHIRAAGAIRPTPGSYDVVFDTARTPGAFRFRYWVDDVTAPRVRLLTPRPRSGGSLRLAATDAGAGVDPGSIVVRVDGEARPASWDARRGRIVVALAGLQPGRHWFVVLVADFQESKNMEDVLPILPNTAALRTSFVLR